MSAALPIIDAASSPAPLPTVRALETLWDEVSTKRLWAPPNFFRFLSLSWSMRTREVNPDDITLIAPTGKVNDCQSCMNNCCVGHSSTVLLRLRDIAALIDLGRTELITQEKPCFDTATLQERPALARQVSSRDWQEFPVLTQNSFGACDALDTEGQCTLYPHWPSTCARFPYTFNPDQLEVLYSRRCDAFWIHPHLEERAHEMAVSAVGAYNARIRDRILLAYASERLEALGIAKFLRISPDLC